MRVVLLLLLVGCQQPMGTGAEPTYQATPPPDLPRTYVFGVHPLHNPRRLDARFGPLTAHLEQLTGLHLRLEASRSYEVFDEKLRAGRFDLALPNPYQTVVSLEHGYHVIGKMGDDESFRGIILTRRDGPKTLAELKGQRIAFPAKTALAATMMPQLYLRSFGLEPSRHYTSVYVGSQDSSIMSVYLGEVAAAATWPPPWKALSAERPELARELVVRWETQHLLNNSVVAKDDVSPEVAQAFIDALVHLNEDAQGRALLGHLELSRFELADDQTYQPVRAFLERYAREIGAPP